MWRRQGQPIASAHQEVGRCARKPVEESRKRIAEYRCVVAFEQT